MEDLKICFTSAASKIPFAPSFAFTAILSQLNAPVTLNKKLRLRIVIYVY